MEVIMKKKEFGEGPLFTATNHIWYFLVGNFYFWLMNIPMLLVLLGVINIESGDKTILLIITVLPMAPALTALLSSMGKLIREKDISITKDYFKAYRTNFFDSIIFGLVQVIVLTVLYVDRIYLATISSSDALQMVMLVIICIFLAIINFYVLPIVSRFYLKRMQIIRLAIYYLFKRIHIALSGMAILYVLWTVSIRGGSVLLLFFASILCYGIMYFQKDTLVEIEARLETSSTNAEA
jgi:uncharacterized membrane protein YesL